MFLFICLVKAALCLLFRPFRLHFNQLSQLRSSQDIFVLAIFITTQASNDASSVNKILALTCML